MIITKTPLRISLFGGGTDFPDYYLKHGGCVLSTAIDKYIYVIIKERFDKKIRIGYTKTELVDSVDEIEHDLIRECLKMTGITEGVEISTMADIPSEGSGLGSSSAVTVGALHAMYMYKIKSPPMSSYLAHKACVVELDMLNSPIGIQDQYMTALGGFELINFDINDYTNLVCHHPSNTKLEQLNQNLMLFYTGITRKANTILKDQKRNTSQNLDVLFKMKRMAIDAHWEILHGDIDTIGYLLNEAWELKKQLSDKISNEKIDTMYQKAKKAGAIGGKICGAGGGGFLLLYCPQDKQNNVRLALSGFQELPFNINAKGTKIIFQE